MPVSRGSFNRIPYIGVFAMAADKFVLAPKGFNVKERVIAESLEAKVIKVSICNSPLIGALAAGNSRGIVTSDLLEREEEKILVDSGVNVLCLKSKLTAMGNLLLVNDEGAIASPDFSKEEISRISEFLDVPVEQGTIAGLKNVGAAAVATNKGVLLHPDVTPEEVELVERVLRVPADIGTACRGVKYVGICAIANSYGALVGDTSTGPELGRFESALGFIRGVKNDQNIPRERQI
ncbi:MAG: hypothetical protein APU95_04950 [Hadesarchaea archaeon YNP_N21]|nr:MAG: hypothetical protein APU95_04950 [Hadesarchaea archaeon YNP_N21]